MKFLQRDIGLRELRDFNKSIMKYISEAVGQHPDMMEAVNMYFSQVTPTVLYNQQGAFFFEYLQFLWTVTYLPAKSI